MTLRLKPTALVIALVAACASCGVADPLADQLVFNEVGATGDDFVELYNVTVARHPPTGAAPSRFTPEQAGWATVCYGLALNPEFHAY